jgi:hypothetical protein
MTTVSSLQSIQAFAVLVSEKTGQIPAGSIVSLSVLCQSSLAVFAAGYGQTNEAVATTVPSHIPTATATQPYTMGMFAFIG